MIYHKCDALGFAFFDEGVVNLCGKVNVLFWETTHLGGKRFGENDRDSDLFLPVIEEKWIELICVGKTNG